MNVPGEVTVFGLAGVERGIDDQLPVHGQTVCSVPVVEGQLPSAAAGKLGDILAQRLHGEPQPLNRGEIRKVRLAKCLRHHPGYQGHGQCLNAVQAFGCQKNAPEQPVSLRLGHKLDQSPRVTGRNARGTFPRVRTLVFTSCSTACASVSLRELFR